MEVLWNRLFLLSNLWMEIQRTRIHTVCGMIFTDSYNRTSWGEKALNVKGLQLHVKILRRKKNEKVKILLFLQWPWTLSLGYTFSPLWCAPISSSLLIIVNINSCCCLSAYCLPMNGKRLPQCASQLTHPTLCKGCCNCPCFVNEGTGEVTYSRSLSRRGSWDAHPSGLWSVSRLVPGLAPDSHGGCCCKSHQSAPPLQPKAIPSRTCHLSAGQFEPLGWSRLGGTQLTGPLPASQAFPLRLNEKSCPWLRHLESCCQGGTTFWD